MASIAWWWAIPVMALVFAVVWAAWHTRTRRSPGMHATVAHFAEYQAVLTRVVTGGSPDADAGADASGDPAADNPNGPRPRAAAGPDVP